MEKGTRPLKRAVKKSGRSIWEHSEDLQQLTNISLKTKTFVKILIITNTRYVFIWQKYILAHRDVGQGHSSRTHCSTSVAHAKCGLENGFWDFLEIWNFSTWLFFFRPRYTWGRSMGPVLSNWVRGLFADLTDVTLADEDTNSILTDYANRAILQGNVAIQVTQPGGKICN